MVTRQCSWPRVVRWPYLFIWIYVFLIGWQLQYVLVSSIHKHESVIGIHMSPPSWTSIPPPTPLHPSKLSQSIGFDLPAASSKFSLATYFTYGNIYFSMLFSQFIPPSPSLTVSTSLFFMSASPVLLCKYFHLYHLSRFHMNALIYNTCLSLSDLFHYV